MRLADEAYRLGPAPAAESYLNADAILEAARRSGAEAVHPGYGFLAENPAFAEAVLGAGRIWVGPPPDAMRLLGDKAAALALAERVGVPVLPGYHGQEQGDQALLEAARGLGFPLLIKAAAGGGGRGIRLVEQEGQLTEALASARREARAAFGDDRLLLERYLSRPRHVEMQLLGDRHGRLLYLGERDCSIQRRHQKVLEEAPAPGFTADQRRAMGEASVALAAGAGYQSTGTVEYLLDERGDFYFMEVNTRLQVEHPVTEAVTGLDLVALQLRIAAGEPLPIRQEDLRIAGHAIEARLYAEDPRRDYAPSAGRLERFQLPDVRRPGVRVDAGYEAGDLVSSYYDSLLAKLIVQAADRVSAIDLLADALAATSVAGPRTNLAQLVAVAASEAFARADLQTGFLAEQGLEGDGLELPDDLLLAVVAAEALDADATARPDDPWRGAGPWRPAWVGSEVRYRHAGQLVRIGLRPARLPGEAWWFELADGRVVRCGARRLGEQVELSFGDRTVRVIARADPAAPGNRLVRLGRLSARLELTSELDGHQAGSAAGELHELDVVTAQLPGRVARVAVEAGQAVQMSQTLVVLEAMKIEHLVGAPRDGTVRRVICREGDQVEPGSVLVELEEN